MTTLKKTTVNNRGKCIKTEIKQHKNVEKNKKLEFKRSQNIHNN